MSDPGRMETDAMGDIAVPDHALWGAQTQRALGYFRISSETMPWPLLHALAQVKQACAGVNQTLGLLDAKRAKAIGYAAGEVMNGAYLDAFPVSVWQSGSGTQTNMNMNEVLANRASALMGGPYGRDRLVHPNDHVNLGQSSNDIIPTAMHLAILQGLQNALLPALERLCSDLADKGRDYHDLVKIGRTHLQDATPLTVAQECSGWEAQLRFAEQQIQRVQQGLFPLAIGGTAVGTGLNTHPDFGRLVAKRLAADTGLPLCRADNPFAALAAHDAVLALHGSLKTLATALFKISSDIKLLASGPRCGLGEWHLPENEPGSSIMPGKVNPSQCEALCMVCCQVIGNDVAIGMAGATGQLQLNTGKPLIAHLCLQSLRLLADSMASFGRHCVRGMAPDRERIAGNLSQSLMLVTALAPHIGYDRAAAIALHAHTQGLSLRAAALELGTVSAAQFDAWSVPEDMLASH
ncbi:lyase family protein [Chitinimonas sp. BJYL2]|uniref:class II fumarate hydratase n=1 Tax=Chitinimonas sp. BJYL2 TaxID=2976696 RepID=UPI0022B4CEAA|nr:class II fumarate hydratase [Chitinimonas sp. BJYL2]